VILLVLHYFILVFRLELLIVFDIFKRFYVRSKVNAKCFESPCFVSLFGYLLLISWHLFLMHECFVGLIEEDDLFEEVSLMILK
jgi:hypothetical protein